MTLSGSPFDYFVAFLGGVLLSFTPCVYPLIPITVGYIGSGAQRSRFKGFTLSLVYASGIAVTYSLLGLIASLTGQIFGAINSSPITYFFVGIIVIVFAISMLDVFVIPIPNFIKLPQLKRQSYLSVFFLGLSSGLIISPCVTPVLGSILLYLTTKKNIFYGMTLLFSFAYGMGLILILVGTFSSVLFNLPKIDKWMVYIKRACSFILMGMGVYLIYIGLRRL